jgi:hypothetical protein
MAAMACVLFHGLLYRGFEPPVSNQVGVKVSPYEIGKYREI